MNTIQTTISNEPVTGFKRVALHENFVICADLNMTQQIRVITVDQTGQPLTERLQNDPSLTINQVLSGQQRYADQLITRQTEGAFVDRTGQVVPAGTEGAISQRDYFQAITLGDLKKQGMSISDKTPVTSLIYAMITGEIGNIDKRGGL